MDHGCAICITFTSIECLYEFINIDKYYKLNKTRLNGQRILYIIIIYYKTYLFLGIQI